MLGFNQTNTLLIDSDVWKVRGHLENSLVVPPYEEHDVLQANAGSIDDTLIKVKKYVSQLLDEANDVVSYLKGKPQTLWEIKSVDNKIEPDLSQSIVKINEEEEKVIRDEAYYNQRSTDIPNILTHRPPMLSQDEVELEILREKSISTIFKENIIELITRSHLDENALNSESSLSNLLSK